MALGQVGIVSLGAYFVIKGDISSGALIAAVILNGRTVQPLIQLTSLLQKFLLLKLVMKNLICFIIISHKRRIEGKYWLIKNSNSITINDLIFNQRSSPILEVKRLNITSNESIGVGSVGSGKSTL